MGTRPAHPALQAECLSFRPEIGAPAFNGHTDWEAVEGFFGLSLADFIRLSLVDFIRTT